MGAITISSNKQERWSAERRRGLGTERRMKSEGRGRKRDMAYLRPQLAPPTLARPLTHTLGQSGRSNNAEGREHFLTSHPTATE